jgi:Ca-activated chloride channel family protein
MEFLWPGLLSLIGLLPVLVLLYVLARRRRRPASVRYSSLVLIREALPGSSFLRRHLPFALFALALAGLAVALARPVVIASVPANQTTIVLAIDVSGSMCSSDIPPSRLQAAEAAAIQFIQGEESSTQIGIVAFSGFAEIVQAPTTDRQTLFDAVRSLTTGRRTAVGGGILEAIDAISEIDPAVAKSLTDGRPGVPPAPVAKGAYVPEIIVLLTDGASNTGPLPLEAAQQALDRGVRVYTIGFGTANPGPQDPVCSPNFIGREPAGGGQGFGGGTGGGPGGGPGSGQGGFRRGIDEDTLKHVAELTGGAYYPAENAEQLERVFRGLPTNLITKHEVLEVGVGFVAFGVLSAGLALLLGRAWRPLP